MPVDALFGLFVFINSILVISFLLRLVLTVPALLQLECSLKQHLPQHYGLNDIEQQLLCAALQQRAFMEPGWKKSTICWRKRLENLLLPHCDGLPSRFECWRPYLSSAVLSWPDASTRAILGTLAAWRFDTR